MAHDPQYLLGVALGFTILPFFILYLVHVLVTRSYIRISRLLAGLVAAMGLSTLVLMAGSAGLQEDLMQTPVPMFTGILVAGTVITVLGGWRGHRSEEDDD